MAGSKSIPKVPDCGKKYYLFKSLGMFIITHKDLPHQNTYTHTGMAIEDVVSAKLVYSKYKEKHL